LEIKIFEKVTLSHKHACGWFYFIGLIPIIGAVWLLVLFCTEGNRGENKYGADPKAIE